MLKNFNIFSSTDFLVCAVLSCSVMSDSVTPWTIARQAPLSMEFFRQEYWSGRILEELFPSLGNLPDPGSEPRSLELQADSLPSHKGSLVWAGVGGGR